MIYSTQFVAALVDGAGGATIYTVPAGKVAVIRDITLREDTGDTATLIIGVTKPGPVTPYIQGWGDVGGGLTVTWQGRHVAVAGDQLWLYSTVGNVLVLISGYLLDD